MVWLGCLHVSKERGSIETDHPFMILLHMFLPVRHERDFFTVDDKVGILAHNFIRWPMGKKMKCNAMLQRIYSIIYQQHELLV